MKKLLLLIAFIGTSIITQTAHAGPALLAGLYNSVSNQLFTVSNTPPVDSKLAKSLNAALSTIQKSGGGADLAAAIKGLGSVVKIVNRTSVSNALQADLHVALGLCVDQYVGQANSYSNQVAGLFPSTARTSALDGISNLLVTLNNIKAMPDLAAAVKALSGVSKQIKSIQKSVTAAQSVPAPASGVTATINIVGTPAFKFNYNSLQATAIQNSGNFGINSGQTVVAGFNTALHNVVFSFNGLVPGANGPVAIVEGAYTKASSDPTAGAFPSTSGTVTATWDPAHKLVTGTFNMTLQEQSGTRTGTMSGSFSLYYP
jgi:hypothetical protein